MRARTLERIDRCMREAYINTCDLSHYLEGKKEGCAVCAF